MRQAQRIRTAPLALAERGLRPRTRCSRQMHTSRSHWLALRRLVLSWHHETSSLAIAGFVYQRYISDLTPSSFRAVLVSGCKILIESTLSRQELAS